LASLPLPPPVVARFEPAGYAVFIVAVVVGWWLQQCLGWCLREFSRIPWRLRQGGRQSQGLVCWLC
jgi:hypothetical protein